jgi:predicted deacetylase
VSRLVGLDGTGAAGGRALRGAWPTADAGPRGSGSAAGRHREPQRLAVSIHEIEPATWERCALLREWLADHGVRRVALLVVPAPDLHPFDRRSPSLRDWLADRLADGDEIVQQGFCPGRGRPSGEGRWRGVPRVGHAGPGEFARLDAEETARALDAGRRILRAAGLAPAGFVPQGFAYTAPLHAALRERYGWWATSAAIHAPAGAPLHAPALDLAGADPVARAAGPLRRRVLAGRAALLRIELHPGDLDHPRRVAAAESLLRRHAGRPAVTGSELVGA